MDDWGQLASLVLPVLTAFAGWAAAKLKGGAKRDKAIEQGVKSLLRGQIIDLGLHYLKAGSIPPYGMDNLRSYYAAYIDLGDGDKSVTDLMEQCKELPLRPAN